MVYVGRIGRRQAIVHPLGSPPTDLHTYLPLYHSERGAGSLKGEIRTPPKVPDHNLSLFPAKTNKSLILFPPKLLPRKTTSLTVKNNIVQ